MTILQTETQLTVSSYRASVVGHRLLMRWQSYDRVFQSCILDWQVDSWQLSKMPELYLAF